MAKTSNAFKKYLTFKNILVGTVIFVIVLIAAIIIGRKIFSSKQNVPITKDQIMIQKGGNTIIVNKDGLIEYRTSDDVFYRRWDAARISGFFDSMEAKARKYLKEGQTEKCPNCYAVTLYIDGKLVTIYVSEDDEELEEIFEEFETGDTGSTGDNEGDLSNFFNDDDGFGTGDTTPVPTTSEEFTPTPPIFSGGGSEQTNYPPVEADCSTWSQDISQNAIISNTLCTVEEE